LPPGLPSLFFKFCSKPPVVEVSHLDRERVSVYHTKCVQPLVLYVIFFSHPCNVSWTSSRARQSLISIQ
jgi:hypothetical protein